MRIGRQPRSAPRRQRNEGGFKLNLRSKTLNLRQRLALLLLLASLPGMAVAVVLAVNALNVQSRQIETTAAQLANLQAAQHGAVVESARIMLDTLIASRPLEDMEGAACQAFFSDWIDKYPSFTSLMLLDAGGEVVCVNEIDGMPLDPGERPWFEKVRAAKEFTVGNYTLGRNDAPVVFAGLPILDGKDGFVGAIAATIDLRWLEYLAGRADLPAATTVTAIGGDGSILVHHVAPDADGGETSAPVPAFELRQQMAVLGQGTVRGPNQEGEPRVYGFHQTDAGGLVVAVGMPPYLTFARYGTALRDTLMAPIAILSLALLAAWWGAERYITRWVRSLTWTTRQMAAGDLGARSSVPHSNYEIGELAAAFDGLAGAMQREQEELRTALEERDTLLRELNHRVKNNIQMVVSLINLQARRTDDEAVRTRLAEIKRRVEALATIHTLLHQGEDRQPAPSEDYPRELCRSLASLYQSDAQGVHVDFEVASVRLTTDQAIPFGLIANELVANAHKHAFASGGTGVIRIAVRIEPEEGPDQTVELTVADDGAGPPDGRDPFETSSTGLQLVGGLARQLNGEITFERQGGLSVFRLRFPLDGSDTA